jgi:hypothetical protein
MLSVNSYWCCLSDFRTKRIGVDATLGKALYPWSSRATPEQDVLSIVVRGAVVIFVDSHLSSKSLLVYECWKQLFVYLYSEGGRQHYSGNERTRMTAAYVRRTDNNISTTSFKNRGGQGKLLWLPTVLLQTMCRQLPSTVHRFHPVQTKTLLPR